MKKLVKIATALTLVSGLCLAGCDKKTEEATTTDNKVEGSKEAEKPAEKKTAAAEGESGDVSTGVPECDEYLKAFEALSKCDKAGPAADGLKQGLEASKKAWSSWKDMDDTSRKAAQDAAGPGCKAGADAIKQTATSLGCG